VLQDDATRCARLAWIDVHTGLGPSGHGERIFAVATKSRRCSAPAPVGPQ